MKMFVKKRPTVVEDAVPATVEQAIPISDVYEDGICLVGRNLWSKTFKFSDINYATASKGDKENMFFAYSAILNSFDTGAMTKITINNRRMNQSKFEKESMLELCGDSLDRYRTEYNRILADNANMSSGITQDKYLTVTVEKKSIEEARTYFNRITSCSFAFSIPYHKAFVAGIYHFNIFCPSVQKRPRFSFGIHSHGLPLTDVISWFFTNIVDDNIAVFFIQQKCLQSCICTVAVTA